MKTTNRRSLTHSLRLLAVGVFIASSAGLFAADTIYTWDPNATGTGSDGSGTWDNVTGDWSTSSADTSLPAATTATLTAALTSGNENTITVASTTGLAVGQPVFASYFASGTTITAISGDTVTLSGNSTGSAGIGSTITSAAGDVVFGNSSTAFTSGANPTVTVSGSQAAGNMTIYNPTTGGDYAFTGGTITVNNLLLYASTSIASTFNWRAITFESANNTLTLSGGSSVSNAPIGAFNGDATGGNASIALTSTIAVTGGTYTTGGAGNAIDIGNATAQTGGLQMSGGTINSGGSFQVGQLTGYSGFFNMTGGTLNLSGQFSVGRNSITTTGVAVVNGGTINLTSSSSNGALAEIGRSNGIGTLDVESGSVSVRGGAFGGIMVINADATNAAASGTLNISGGTVTVSDLRLNGGNVDTASSTAGTANVNMTGGALYIGGTISNDNGSNGTIAGGIDIGGTGNTTASTATYNVTLSGGTVGANAAWSSVVNMTLGTTNGSITFQTANATGTAYNIALYGNLTGAGGLVKTGAGTLSLAGNNTYTGGTVVNQGTLNYGANFTMNGANAFGIAGVGTAGTNYATSTITAGTLTFGGTLQINVSTSLTGGQNFNLFTASGGTTTGDFTGVSIAGNYIASLTGADGVWTGSASGLEFTFTDSTGILSVASAIPEPATYAALFGLAALGFVAFRRRRRS